MKVPPGAGARGIIRRWLINEMGQLKNKVVIKGPTSETKPVPFKKRVGLFNTPESKYTAGIK